MAELENTPAQQGNTETSTSTGTEPEKKSYTQEELDAIIEKRIARDRRTRENTPEYKAFKEWEDSQKTKEEKESELQKKYDLSQSELAVLKAEKKVISANAKPEFAEFVASKVLSMGDDFEANLAEYKKNNPQYFGETVVKKVSTSPDLSGKAGASTTNDKMNNLIRGARK
jgi:hypothetical protein